MLGYRHLPFFYLNRKDDIMEKKYKIGGMACGGCVANVERALRALPKVEMVKVELSSGVATVKGDVTDEEIAETIENIGFDFLGVE